ncbi:MAG: GGDEF domain-containing protein [Clostridia bacterium]|nr:GGDEF domain-containing protein [Clostridia bacterium]
MALKNSERSYFQNVPSLRLIVCILFFPCFFLMDKNIPLSLYFVAIAFLLYAILLITFPTLNISLNNSYPLTHLGDMLFISLLLAFDKKYSLSLSLFYIIPIITVSLGNKKLYTYLITSMSSISFILISIINDVNLPSVILQIIFFFIISFYTLKLTETFHKSYFVQANQDTLTKINNRRFFNHSLKSLAEKNIPFSLILIDLDNFKLLNDTEGHYHGDYVLKIIALIMKECTRDSDIISRFGGDEFAIILPESSKETSKNIAERIRNNVLVNPKFIPYSKVSLSMGIATFPNDGDTIEDILKKADEALYTAKDKGKNFIQLY